MRNVDSIVQELADREAIRELARRYAHYVWQKEVRAAADLFTEDGVMDTGTQAPIQGREAIFATYSTVFAQSDFFPFVHNHVIDLDGDSARGTCYLDLRATQEGRRMIGFGVYEDAYVRVAGEWKFRSRSLRINELVPLREDPASR